MTEYRALRDLTHVSTGEFCSRGTIISSGKDGFLQGRSQAVLNILLMAKIIEEIAPEPRKTSSKTDNKDDE